MSVPIHLRNTPQEHGRAEIIDHAFLISYLAKWYKPNLYVEYGVRGADCIYQVLPYCKKVWGVDIAPSYYRHPDFEFFQMSTREFKGVLETRKPVIDMAFIDACHKSEVVLQDFDDLFPYVIEDGLIFLHDTYPMSREYTSPDYCNDCWRVPNALKNKYQGRIEILTLPVQPGLTMVKKLRQTPLEWMTE